ncbi:MAG: glycoside hydrolase family 3 N-terminal domain-containing protein [Propionibacteriaceae bacterium]|nr:glycoside hydrolase family 3 N-terminal domain-containing protein [Propionibacteriaceae bacterium]
MSMEEKVGQLFILFAYGQTASSNDTRNTTLYGVPNASQIIDQYMPGGFIIFSARDNVTNPTQVALLSNGLQASALNTGAGIPLLVSTDQEHGVVTRIGPPATQFPGNMALGAGRSAADTRTAAAIAGRELAAMGIHQNNAPDVDVNVNPDNPVIGVRSFSSRTELVSELGAATIRGYQDDARVIATAKHFPGHGDTATDSHTGLPVITHTLEEWQTIDAPPFQAAIDAGVDSIMTAHIVVPSLDDSGDPATLSKKIVTGQLRDAMGFEGVIVTDGLEMAGVRQKYGDGEVAVRALEAGVDQLLLPAAPQVAYQAVNDAIDSGRLSEQRIDESVKRILAMKHTQGVIARPTVQISRISTWVGTGRHLRTADHISDRTTTVLRNEGASLPVDMQGKRVLVTGWGVSTTQTLATELTKHGATVTTMTTGASPTAAQRAAVVAEAQQNQVTVILTNNVAAGSAQQQLANALYGTGTDVVTAAVRNPYDIARLPDAPNFIATYSYSPVAISSLARVITGEIAPSGKLPVDVLDTEDPEEVLYPFGFGLTW